MEIIVDVADMRASREPGTILVAPSLGSCIGLVLYDPVAKVGGILHYMLPDSSLNPQRAQENPFIFADTAVPRFIESVLSLGAHKNDLQVKVAGGAQIMGDSFFQIGRKNYVVLRNLLWEQGLAIVAEHVGGRANRTIRLEIGTGRVTVRIPGFKEFDL